MGILNLLDAIQVTLSEWFGEIEEVRPDCLEESLRLLSRLMNSDGKETPESLEIDLADALSRLSHVPESASMRRGLLEYTAALLERVFASNPTVADQGLKLAALYLYLAVHYKPSYAEDGLVVARKIAGEEVNQPFLNYLLAQLCLLTRDNGKARTYFEAARQGEIRQPLQWPNYEFYQSPQSVGDVVSGWAGLKSIHSRLQSSVSDLRDTPDLKSILGLTSEPLQTKDHPYRAVPTDTGFWKTAVARRMPNDMAAFYRKKFDINKEMKIMSLGSCFAQHIGRALKDGGFNFLDYEPDYQERHYFAKPASTAFGYDMYSARYGNIYTVRQLCQLFRRAFGQFTPVEEFWYNGGRWYDPFRPTIEPSGYATVEEAGLMRQSHLGAVKRLFETAELLIFTLGLTEAWASRRDGAVYPVCPGTAAGVYDPVEYAFKNFSYGEISDDLEAFIQEARAVNPALKFLFTVSPVPLTATASGNHVLVATMRSKAILRAAAAAVYERYEFVDYFPSYDVISSIPFARGAFQDNLRTVKPEVVAYVMDRFFLAHGYPPADRTSARNNASGSIPTEEQCDEILLEAFAT